MALTFGKLHQRLTFYHESEYLPQEIQNINEFKIWCKGHGHAIPERDEEVLRALYARKMDPKAAYEAIIAKQQFMNDTFPITPTDNVRRMLEEGVFYLAGRDKHFRVVMVVSVDKLQKMKPQP